MAKNYRSTLYDTTIELGALGSPVMVAQINPIDSQQSLGSYLSNVKVSVLQSRMVAGPAASTFMIYAATDDSTLTSASVVTAHVTTPGGGTVNLSLKRRILDSEEDPSRSDGPIYIWVEHCANDVSTSDSIFINLVCEAWGRFVEVGSA